MIYFDAHMHVYLGANVDTLCDALSARAARMAPGATVALALMERAGQGTFAAWAQAAGAGTAPAPTARWTPRRLADATCVVMSDGAREILVFAGRQVAAAERVEALALFGRADVPDGLPLTTTLARLQAAGMLPVLAWGLGKWLFARAAVVRSALNAATADTLLVGDSALRPTFWGEPRPMAAARRRGLRVLCGSDPLPRPGEERIAGQYATAVHGDLDPAAPSASLRSLLLAPGVVLTACGRRHGPFATLRRLT